MKIQIQDQSLRVRLDESELARLLDGQPVQNQTRLVGQGIWSQTVQLNEQALPQVCGSAEALLLTLPRDAVTALSARLPCRDGLGWELAAADEVLRLQLDVDVRDSVRQRGVQRRTDATVTPTG
ncbi:hypothetical protein [Stenotrophomonas sp. SY1]|uniref:DUF7009 family protein n=1 Tax=Stenotrophomonas sp. SY1 TaxID=477235 RepID=UPI001E4985C7|nr:hypothetical protein [Stenotrophomonas sp. SY1]MCD9086971.1 hypothetical protein [Stenotrophomonas sp. SY1]